MPMHGLLMLHVTAVSLMMAGFLWRLSYAWRGQVVPYAWLRRGLPDTIDVTVLLSGVSMAWLWDITPWEQSWFAWKLLCVVLYIAAGFVCFSARFSLPVRRMAAVFALLMLMTIVKLVVTK